MTLLVPLTVRLGNEHITRAVSDVSFRKDAVGGLRSMSLSLKRGIDNLDPDLAPLTKVYIYDGRTAAPVAEGRLADSGRSAGSDGQSWEVVAFGPAQHASDIERPLIYTDRSMANIYPEYLASTEGSAGPGMQPLAQAKTGLLINFGDGMPINNNTVNFCRYADVANAGQKIALIASNWTCVRNDANFQFQVYTYTQGSSGEMIRAHALNGAGGANVVKVVGTDFPNGRNLVDFALIRVSGGAATVIGDDIWIHIDGTDGAPFVVRTLLHAKDGSEVTTGYTVGHVLAHEVVADLLGRVLPEFDGAGASIATNTAQINQMAYHDGVTAAQVLEDLMKIEPAYRWYATPDTTGNGYGFRWEPWPTSVRYEATLDDGGSFPLTAQNLYNKVVVKWQDSAGRERRRYETSVCPTLDNLGVVRQKVIDLGTEVGSDSLAATAAYTFLAEHNVPSNSGSISIARPIRDVISGRMVEPWEIEAGELIRVRGVESYPDSLNADSSDGQTVFRIFAVDYSSSDNTAKLELDTDPTDTAAVLAKLITARNRK